VRVTCASSRPGLQLLSPDGKALAQWSSFVSPGELGLALRRNLEVPAPFAAAGRPGR
jgi:hypothetical protein